MRFSQIWHLSLVFTIGCSSLQPAGISEQTQKQRSELQLTATVYSLFAPKEVEFIAKIKGDIDWCPDEIIWQWADGFSREEVDCNKIFSKNRMMIWGLNRVWIKIYHNGKLMGVEFVDVRVGS